MMILDSDYQGSTVIGEKGQLVIPANIRKEFGIKSGDKFIVLAGRRLGAWGIVLVPAEVITNIVEKMFGGEPEDEMLKRLMSIVKEGEAE